MKLMTHTTSIILALGLVACTAPKTTPTHSNTSTAEQIRPLLMARHTIDLPTKETLNKHDDPESALIELAQTDEVLVVQARALSLLGYYETANAEAALLTALTDERTHAKLRAAALQGLSRYNLEKRSALRATVIGYADHTDARIGVAAVLALATAPSARVDLQRIASDDSVNAQVRQKAEDVLTERAR